MTIQDIPDSLGLVLAKSSGHLYSARFILYSRAALGRFKGLLTGFPTLPIEFRLQ